VRYITKKEIDNAIQETRQDLLELEAEIGRESFLQIFEDYNPSCEDNPPSFLKERLFGKPWDDKFIDRHSMVDDYILSVWERNNKIGKITKARKWTLQTEWNRVRREILERDAFRCQDCGAHKNLCVHHVKDKSKFPELTYEPTNLITLCKSCHVKRHPEKKSLILSKGNRKAALHDRP